MPSNRYRSLHYACIIALKNLTTNEALEQQVQGVEQENLDSILPDLIQLAAQNPNSSLILKKKTIKKRKRKEKKVKSKKKNLI